MSRPPDDLSHRYLLSKKVSLGGSLEELALLLYCYRIRPALVAKHDRRTSSGGVQSSSICLELNSIPLCVLRRRAPSDLALIGLELSLTLVRWQRRL